MTGVLMITKGGGGGCRGEATTTDRKSSTTTTAKPTTTTTTTTSSNEDQTQLSLVALLFAAIRKSMVSCRVNQQDEVISSAVHQMDIGWPTNVRHVAHVTFDRFNGFLGLPVEFQVEVPSRAPSARVNGCEIRRQLAISMSVSAYSRFRAEIILCSVLDLISHFEVNSCSASVFGVSAASMQCSYDSKGNSVPTILLLMQDRLYSQGGLKAEGVFRINPENSQEELVRDQLNKGIVPDDIDVHCLAGLIKAWFRELPEGVLDGLSPEQVLQCNTEEECVELVKQLLPIQSALLNWAVDLMADVVEEEEFNKMNARNIAMVFAPNMTQMSDPLTALMHAVQVMNLLKTLIIKTLREREETATGGYSPFSSRNSDRQGDQDFDSHHETDTSCELRTQSSHYSDHADYSHHSSENEEEGEPMDAVEECFLRQLEEDEYQFVENEIQECNVDPREQYASPSTCSGFNAESGFSISGSKTTSSGSSTSDKEGSPASTVTKNASTSEGCQRKQYVEMVEKQEPIHGLSLPMPV
ncbi:hypothetical protein Syun_028990 [Stephania yunnanensis]|uniref:Rho GTPase-activating protein 2 n=1 Tax=Stephania yunnanensis TaxID=152371 RepID=A0AAP0HJE5_9MAGN